MVNKKSDRRRWKWYDGFIFGKYTDIYNPWSILSFINKKGEYAAYWANARSNDLVSTLIQPGDADTKKQLNICPPEKAFVDVFTDFAAPCKVLG